MIINADIRHQALLTVTPSDPLVVSGNTFSFGLGSEKSNITLTQAYGMKFVGLASTLTIDLDAGTVSGGGGTQTVPPGGKDADGATIALDRLKLLHIRNTGSVALTLTFTNLFGGAVIVLPAGGRFEFEGDEDIGTSVTCAVSGGSGAGSDLQVLVGGTLAV